MNSDTYTEDELVRGSMWHLQSSRATRLQIHIRLRDRAMLLISTSSAFRGDNTRRLLLSDLSVQDVRMIDLGLDTKVMVCSFLQVTNNIFDSDNFIMIGIGSSLQSREDKQHRTS
jgi:hypothetical protein